LRSLTAFLAALVLALPAMLALKAPAMAEEEPAFRELFDGQTLEGWAGDKRIWSVEDGAITGRLTEAHQLKRNTFLIWHGGTLRDFELHISFKITGGNSGVQYRSQDLGDFAVAGYQADIVAGDPDRYTGILYEERGRGIVAERGQKVSINPDGEKQITGTLGSAEELAQSIRKNDWNEYAITARGNHLVQAINGRTMVSVIDEQEGKAAREGILALQVHTGPAMTVQFKDIRLKALKQ
jgi:hypothetical protein